jgi:hypothetical protein
MAMPSHYTYQRFFNCQPSMQTKTLNLCTKAGSQERLPNEEESPVCSTSTSEHSAEHTDSPGQRPYDPYLEHHALSLFSQPSDNSKRKSNIALSRENILKEWGGSDDDQLMKLADQYKNDWKKIAKRITVNSKKKVTPNFLKNRYKEVAGDHIKKGVKFSHEEDLKIAELFNEHGTQWTKIAAHFVDRTPVMIKNRYYSHIRRKGLLCELSEEARKDFHGEQQTHYVYNNYHGQNFVYPDLAGLNEAFNQLREPVQNNVGETEEYHFFEPTRNDFDFYADELHSRIVPVSHFQ